MVFSPVGTTENSGGGAEADLLLLAVDALIERLVLGDDGRVGTDLLLVPFIGASIWLGRVGRTANSGNSGGSVEGGFGANLLLFGVTTASCRDDGRA